MSAEDRLPPVSPDEWLARFITKDKWVRPDKTLRQDAFIPPRDLKLSVTRHLGLSEDDLWNLGQRIADVIAKKRTAGLTGRADITVQQVAGQNLNTEAAPLSLNLNHAHIVGWPAKPAQKTVAQELAAIAKFVPRQ